MKWMLHLILATLGGWFGWLLGAHLGAFGGFFLSLIGTAGGVYLAARITRRFTG